MFYIVNIKTEEILFRVDAWDADLDTKVNNFFKDNTYKMVKRDVTFNGDMILWVR